MKSQFSRLGIVGSTVKGLCFNRFLIVVGAVAVLAATASGDDPRGIPGRPWHVNLTVREEYDDNADTAPNKRKEGSFNTLVIPSAGLLLPLENTQVSASYEYEMKFFESPPRDENSLEHTHTFNLGLTHHFTERTRLELTNILVRAAEPEAAQIDRQGVPTVVQREGDYWNNKTETSLGHRLNERWSGEIGGFWSLWRYDDSGVDVENDRDTYDVRGSAYYDIDERTAVGLNYRFQGTEYVWPKGSGTNTFADSRNSVSHIPSVSLKRRLSPTLALRLEGGLEVREPEDGGSDVTPTADLNLRWQYLPRGNLYFIFSYLLSDSSEDDYRTSESASARIFVSHPITRKLRANLDSSFTYVTFEDPDPNAQPAPSEQDEKTIRTRAELEYELTRWCFAQVGYTFTKVISDFEPNEFERNRGYVGFRLAY